MNKLTLRRLVSAALLLPASTFANTGFVGTPVLPDYVITDMKTYEVGDQTYVEVTVANQGAEPDQTVDFSQPRNDLYVFATSGGDTYSNSTLFKSWRIAYTLGGRLLSSGESVTLTTSYETARLRGQIWTMVDQYNQHEEANEDNNVFPRVDSDLNYTVALSLDGESSEIAEGDMVRLVLTATPDGDSYRELAAIVSVTDASGNTVYRSGELPLVANGDAYEGEAWIETLGYDAGDYEVSAKVIDADGESVGSAALSVTLVAADDNHNPVAGDDSAETQMDEPVLIDVIYNDSDTDGDYLWHHVVGEVSHGSVEELRGSVIFTPEPGFVGVAGFRYQLNDLVGGSDWADVTVNVLPPESGSCSWGRDYEVATSTERTAIDGWADFELADDARPEYAAQVLSNDNPDLFEEQPFISYPSCSLYFTPKSGAVGTATLTYAVMDEETEGGVYRSAERSFSISLLPQGDAPEIATTPVTLTNAGSPYSYTPELASNGSLTVSAETLPDFLTLEGNTVSGTPATADIGLYDVVLTLQQGQYTLEQAYKLTVEPELASSQTPVNGTVLEDDSQAAGTTQGYISSESGGALGGPLLALLAALGWRRRRH
ncbi:Ig-like domain-containing protein [Granulosicoccaceae sp. 1_MG-2023]|nr:Ig-like domain-containing protein [Granulosicoccaceae sp. 1_MG-2023]